MFGVKLFQLSNIVIHYDVSVFTASLCTQKQLLSESGLKKGAFTHQINLFHFANGCVKSEVCFSNLS